ncbi:MAG: hypothetical protein ABFR33_09015 [Verrucomicrobiota bacterium]
MSTSEQRVLNAVNHRNYDRIPVDFWSTAETDGKLLKHLGLTDRSQLLDEFGVDVFFIEGPKYTGYLVTVTDARGEIIAVESSANWLCENLENLKRLSVGNYMDKTCRRTTPARTKAYRY